jgi:hypothetical protein
MKWLGPSAIQPTRAPLRVSFLLSPDVRSLHPDGFYRGLLSGRASTFPVDMKNLSSAFTLRGAGCAPRSLAHRGRRISGATADNSSSPT